jgi:hypothetical protein
VATKENMDPPPLSGLGTGYTYYLKLQEKSDA